ncbi:MAG: hypothetical protein GYA15_10355 [Leptolinea sp.]|nr:hypothetical protein [Leptolinea sp.]
MENKRGGWLKLPIRLFLVLFLILREDFHHGSAAYSTFAFDSIGTILQDGLFRPHNGLL